MIMTSITWAGPSCVQELGTFLAPQNRTQARCVPLLKSLECETNLDKMCTLPKKDDTINGQWNCYHPDECPEEELDSG